MDRICCYLLLMGGIPEVEGVDRLYVPGIEVLKKHLLTSVFVGNDDRCPHEVRVSHNMAVNHGAPHMATARLPRLTLLLNYNLFRDSNIIIIEQATKHLLGHDVALFRV